MHNPQQPSSDLLPSTFVQAAAFEMVVEVLAADELHEEEQLMRLVHRAHEVHTHYVRVGLRVIQVSCQ